MIGEQGSFVPRPNRGVLTDGDPSIVAGVGKSCLERQFTATTLPEAHEPTIGFEFGTRTIAVDDKRIKLYIWDMVRANLFLSTAWCTTFSGGWLNDEL